MYIEPGAEAAGWKTLSLADGCRRRAAIVCDDPIDDGVATRRRDVGEHELVPLVDPNEP